MEEFDNYDFDEMMGSLGVRHMLSCLKISLKRMHLSERWSFGDDLMFYYTKWNNLPNCDTDSARIFALADYVTYIPYAEEGYKILQESFERQGKCLEEWRYQCFLKILGGLAQKFSQGKLQRVKNFFYARCKNKVHMDNIEETASLVLRAHHCVEVLGDDDFSLDDMVCDYFGENAEGDADELLKTYAPALPPLGPEEREFVLDTANRIEQLL